MSSPYDFAELRTPSDLLRKLHHDLKRMETAKHDQYAAFDFFITADSIVDWLYPEVPGDKVASREQKEKQSALRKTIPLVRITAHIANGAKHFVVTRHNSIMGVEKDRYVEAGYVEDGYINEPLVIHLTPDESAGLGIQSPIEAVRLAHLVLQHWAGYKNVA